MNRLKNFKDRINKSSQRRNANVTNLKLSLSILTVAILLVIFGVRNNVYAWTSSLVRTLNTSYGAMIGADIPLANDNDTNALLVKYGLVGIGATNPNANSKITIGNGDNSTGSNNKAQISFGFNTSGDYPQWIRTRHNSSAPNNAIDFYTSNGTQNGVFPTNAVLGLSINNGNVGIGISNPSAKLDVYGQGGLIAGYGNIGSVSTFPLANTGKVLIGWNKSGYQGEIDFISNRDVAAAGNGNGGFAFYDYTNTGALNSLMTINGSSTVSALQFTANTYCIGASCITSWPTGGSGSNISSVLTTGNNAGNVGITNLGDTTFSGNSNTGNTIYVSGHITDAYTPRTGMLFKPIDNADMTLAASGGGSTRIGYLAAYYGTGWSANGVTFMYHDASNGAIQTNGGDLNLLPAGGNVNITGNLSATGLAASGISCLQVNGSGVISRTGSACGSGGSTGNVVDTLSSTLGAGGDASGQNIRNVGVENILSQGIPGTYVSGGSTTIDYSSDGHPAITAGIVQSYSTDFSLWTQRSYGTDHSEGVIAFGDDSNSGLSFEFWQWAGTTPAKYKTPVSVMYLNPDGNVGIGTTNPSAKLDVKGTLMQSGGYSYLGDYNIGVATYPRSGHDLAVAWNWTSGDRDMSFWNTDVLAGTSFSFKQLTSASAKTDLLTIMSSGNVGIGTASPGAKLDVQGGGINTSGGLNVGGGASITGNVAAGNVSLNGKSVFHVANDWFRLNENSVFTSGIYTGSSIFRIDGELQVGGNGATLRVLNDGNVGIGNTNPTSLLAVSGKTQITDGTVNADTAIYGTFGVTRSNSADTLSYITMTRSGSSVKSMGINSSDSWIFGVPVGFTDKIDPQMTITVGGNVGIGKTNPACKLDVNGSICKNGSPVSGTNNFIIPMNGGIGNTFAGCDAFVPGATLVGYVINQDIGGCNFQSGQRDYGTDKYCTCDTSNAYDCKFTDYATTLGLSSNGRCMDINYISASDSQFRCWYAVSFVCKKT